MNGKRIISSLLSLAMVFSLNTGMSFAEEAQPVTEEPVVEEQVSEEPQDEVDVVPEEVVVEEQTEDVTEEVEEVEADTEQKYPAQTFTGITPDGTVSVKVEAGEGTLPEGTTMYVYNVNEADISALVDSVVTGTEKTIVAADIIFLDKDGYEIEPLTDVTITLENLTAEKSEDYSLVHINQANEVSLVKDTKILSLTEEKVVFTADVFSIYAIVEDGSTIDDKYRMTFEFLDQYGGSFEFINDAGDPVTNQILKNGESLQDVGLPHIDVEHNETFNGWYYWDPDTETFGTKVEFDTPITVTKNGTTYIKANVATSYYLTFHEDSKTNSGVHTKKQVGENTQYDINQQTVEIKKSHMAFVGWSDTSFDGDDISQDTRQPISPGTITVTEDKDLYPIFRSSHFLNFVSSQIGSGASFIPGVDVLYGETTVEPNVPTWTGYVFDYWSTTPHVYEGEGRNTKIVSDGSSGKYTFGQPLNDDTTLYAYWKPATTNYHVVYWQQNVTDDKNANDSEKTYYYAGMNTYQAEAFSTVNRPGESSLPTYEGFKLNTNKGESSITVEADGSSVINVYYDRQLVTFEFLDHQPRTGGYESSEWNNPSFTWTGLYGQETSKYEYTWPSGVWTYYTRSGTSVKSFLGQFVLDDCRDPNNLLFRAYKSANSGNLEVRIYTEKPNGEDEWKLAGEVSTSGSTWNFTEKFDGYTVYQYRKHTTGWGGGWTDWITKGSETSTSLRNVDEFEIRYRAKEKQLLFVDPLDETNVFKTVTLKYGTSLSSQKPTFEPDCPYPGMKFNDKGLWYADKTGGTEFDWENSVMPNADLRVYAKWEDIWYWIKVDPNGGELAGTESGGSTWFWETYGNKVEEYAWITRDYVEDPSGTYIYQYDEFNEKDPDGDQPTTRAAKYVEGDGSQKYTYEPGSYELIGWYNVDPSTEQVTTPYNFSDGVTGNVYIRAMWRKLGEYRIIYDANGGSNAPTDPNSYADGSDTAILEECTPPNKKVFVGWEYNGTVYKPGDVITIDASLATDKEITVKAVYKDYKDVPIKTTHISWFGNKYDVAGFEINGISSTQQYSKESNETPYNEAIPIANLSDLGISTQYGEYTFLGWARVDEDMTEAEIKNLTEDDLYLKYDNGKYLAQNTSGNWVEVESVGADENEPYHAMYALWQAEFKVYHSGVSSNHIETVKINKTTCKNGTYDLTSNLTDNTIYGGYYLNKTDLTESSPAYDGTNDTYTWTDPETAVPGTQIVPTPGEIYYIKEVPVTYLKPYLEYTYKKGENTIKNLYFLSAIDDVQYDSVGFEIVLNPEDALVYKAVTITAANTGTSIRFTPANMFGLKDGLVTAFDATNYLEPGSSINVKPYWVTPDKVTAFGNTERIITNDNGTTSGFTYDDIVTSPSIQR